MRFWPWLLIALGAILLVAVAGAGRRRWLRESYMSGGWRPCGDYPTIYHDTRKFNELAGRDEVDEARRLVQSVLLRPTLSKTDQDALLVLITRLDVQRGILTEDYLWSFLDPEGNESIWYWALEQIREVRLARGDRSGAVQLLEEVVDGGYRHPVLDRVPFPYLENEASERLSRLHIEAGDGPLALYWARRHKDEFAVDFDAPCGNAYSGEQSGINDLMRDASRMAGVEFEGDDGDYWRRKYGPTWPELLGAFYAAAALVLAGVWARLGGPFLRLFWVRRGPVARVVISAVVAAGLAPQLWILAVEGGPPTPTASLWMALLAPAFVVPSIALYGACLAPRGVKRAVGIVKGSKTTSAAAERGMSKRKNGSIALATQQSLPPKLYSTSVRTPPKT